MSTTASETKPLLPKTDVLRKNVIDRINQFTDEELAILHDLLLRAQKEQLWRDISEDAARDHAAGLMNDLPRLLREAREALRAKA